MMAGIIPFNRFNAIEDPTRYFDMMDDFFNFGNSLAHHSMQAGTFKMDVQDNKDAFVVEAELPGVDKDDINLEFNDDQLTIAVNHSERGRLPAREELRPSRASSGFHVSQRLPA